MKIVFHGSNSHAFRPGIERFLADEHAIVELDDALAADDARTRYAEAEVIVGIRLTRDMPVGPALRLYQLPATGHDGIDQSCLPASVPLCNCFGHEDAIAEYVMAALLSRHVPLAEADRDLRAGRWTFWAGGPAGLRSELGGTAIGILGFGHIGKAIAARAKAFSMRVTAANRSAIPSTLVDEAFGLDRLGDFMASADVIVSTLPLTEATRGLVDAVAIARMRPDAVLVNVGRGPVIDEQALFDALTERRIGGAVIDTWYNYPATFGETARPSGLPFEILDNVVMTPHMSGWTRGTIERRQRTMAENINRLVKGHELLNKVGR